MILVRHLIPQCVDRHKIQKRRTLLSLAYGGFFALSCCCPAVAGVLFVLLHGPGAASAFGVLDAGANAKAAAKAAPGQVHSWCFIGPPAGRSCVRPGHGPVLAGARLASWLKAQSAAAAAVSCACWGVGACRRPRPMATLAAACRPATELRLALALCHVRVLSVCLGLFS